jgi:hypothetical protein
MEVVWRTRQSLMRIINCGKIMAEVDGTGACIIAKVKVGVALIDGQVYSTCLARCRVRFVLQYKYNGLLRLHTVYINVNNFLC